MSFSLLFVLVSGISMMPYPTHAQDGGRELYFPAYYFFAEKRLLNHVINTVRVEDLDQCEYRCYRDANCVSVNIKNKDPDGTHECELNNSTHVEHDGHLEDNQLYYYRGAENKCGKNRRKCENNATCQSGFTQKGYRCSCTSGFEGEHCKKDIDECDKGSHKCHVNATCINTKGGYNCSCNQGYSGDGQNCMDIDECATATHTCDKDNHFVCRNTEGSFTCRCADGYVRSGNGIACEDIDECATATHTCDKDNHFVCRNTEGSFTCRCADGYVRSGNGIACEVDPCHDYHTINSSDRNLANVQVISNDCDHFTENWYRFQGAAGTRMPTQCPSIADSLQIFPAWLDVQNNRLPYKGEGVKNNISVCLPWRSPTCCKNSFKISVKNCTSYLVYKLPRIPHCPYRYCGTN